jgi:haloalkane dehalogenase
MSRAPGRRLILAISAAPPPVQVRVAWGAADTIFRSDAPDVLDRAFGRSPGVRRLEGSKPFWPEERSDIVVEEARRLWTAFAPRGEGVRR